MIPFARKYSGPKVPTTYAVSMTAAASGSNGITVADDDDIDFGTGDFFLHWEGSLPDWTPASTVIFAWKFSTVGYLPSVRTSGVIRIQINGTTYESTVATGLANNASAKIDIIVTRESASVAGSVVFYLNGSQLGASVAIAAGAPATIDNTSPLYISGTASARSASNTISCIVGNFAPTAAEVLDLCTNGIPASWKWGSQADIVSGWNFTSGWTTSSATNTDANTITFSASNGYSRNTYSMTLGAKYALRFKGTTDVTLRIQNRSLTENYVSSISPGSFDATYIFTPTLATTGIAIKSLSGAGYVDVDTMEVRKIGATMALLPNSIPTSGATAWDDSSGNTGGGTLPAAGASKVTIRK